MKKYKYYWLFIVITLGVLILLCIQREKEIVVATYNIATLGDKTNAIGQFIESENIDIIGLQQVDRYTDRNNKDMLKEIAESCNYNFYYYKNLDIYNGQYGIGILAKDTIKHKKGEHLYSASYEQRGYQRAVIKKGNKEVAVYNTHLSYENRKLREKQIKELLKIVENDKYEYKIIMGDFNMDQSSNEYKVFEKNYNMANGQNGIWEDTFVLKDDTMKFYAVDNIITTKNIEILDIKTIDNKEIGSDHKMVLARLKLK